MTRIASPFAASGDKEQIPQTKQDTGEISFSEGYGPDYEKDLDNDTGAKTIERAKLNWLLCLVTSEIKKYQEQGIPDYISKEDNGGIDYAYAAAAMVRYNNKIYYSLKDANTDKPDTNSWSLLDPSEYLSVSGGTINGDLTIKGSLDINGEQPYTPTNPPPATPNSLAIGTVMTLEPGAQATAEITGEAPEQTLSLGIPAGAQGENGKDGAGGSNIKISSGGMVYEPNSNGVITLGSASGKDIEQSNRDVSWPTNKIPEWMPTGARDGLETTCTRAEVINWQNFDFTPGYSYAISKKSNNDPLINKSKDPYATWQVTCVSRSFSSDYIHHPLLIVRESSSVFNDVYIVFRYKSTSGDARWAIGTIPMLDI